MEFFAPGLRKKHFHRTTMYIGRKERLRLTCIHGLAQLDPTQITGTQKNPPPTPRRRLSPNGAWNHSTVITNSPWELNLPLKPFSVSGMARDWRDANRCVQKDEKNEWRAPSCCTCDKYRWPFEWNSETSRFSRDIDVVGQRLRPPAIKWLVGANGWLGTRRGGGEDAYWCASGVRTM